MMKRIYLDYNATTPVSRKAIEAAIHAMESGWGNPGCTHEAGIEAKRLVELAKEKVARMINCHGDEIVFVSGATEANNTVLLSILPHVAKGSTSSHLITTEIEHPSVLNPSIRLMELGYKCTFLKVDKDGRVDPRAFEAAIRPTTKLASIMLANNELGTIEPVREIAEIAKRHGILIHTDASQAIGKIPVDVESLGVDYLTIAGHKFYAPKGIGCLYVRRKAPFSPMFFGGGQIGGRRPGTEPVPLMAALGASAEEVSQTVYEEGPRQKALRDYFYGLLKERIGEERVLANVSLETALPNTLSVRFKGVEARNLLSRCRYVMASTGAACHEVEASVSHVLAAIGLGPKEASETVRFSLGRYTDKEAIEIAVKDIERAYMELKEVRS